MGNITVYKLTTQDNKTRKGEFNECTWGPGVSHSGTGHGDLCGPGYIHAYLSPLLAVFLNPIHANIPSPKLWECSVSAIAKSDKDLKVGAITLTTEKEIPLPTVSARQRVIFAILCAEKAQESTKHLFGGNKPWQVTYRTKMKIFFDWAEDYKQGRAAAYAAAYAADAAYAAYAAYASARAAARADADSAAYAAARAADAAADAAAAYASAYAADASADAAYAAADAAYASARAAARAATKINLSAIAAMADTYK